MIRIAIAAALALAITSFARPAYAVVIDTNITSNGEPVGGATIRLETLDGDPIKLTAVEQPPKDESKSATPVETAPPSAAPPAHDGGNAPGMPAGQPQTGDGKQTSDTPQDSQKKTAVTANDEAKSKTAAPAGNGSDKADAMTALLTDKDGKLSALLDDSFKNKTVLVVVEKDGQVLMKKTVELNKDVNRVAIGVPPERLAMLPQPNAGPPGGVEPKQETPVPPPAASSAALVPERSVGPPELAITIGREGECQPGGDCCYRLTVTNAGAGPWRGPIGLSDETSFAPAALDIERSRPLWWCSQAGQTTTCASAPLTLAKGQSTVLQQCLLLPRRMSSAVRKCVRIIWPGAGGPDADRDRMRLVQIALSQRGHDPGIADGLMGRKTERSIGAFRKANALPPDGGIDQSLLAALLGDAAAAPGDPNSANDGACDEFTVTPGTVDEPQRPRTPSTVDRPRRPRTDLTADRPRRSRPPPIDDDDEPPPRRGPNVGPLIDMGIGIGVGRIFRGGRGRGGGYNNE